jgi:plastocyanin
MSKLAREMRPKLVSLAVALAASLALASPAAAFDFPTQVVDFEFRPAERRIALGDSVTWNFQSSGHTSTSVRGQPDSWNSAPGGATSPAGSSYTKVFNVPGRYQYVCTPHASFMKGVIEVGTDEVVDSVDAFRAKRRGNRVRVSFQLNEPATVRYTLRGPSRRTVKLGREQAGDHAFTLRRLKRGTYRGVLTVVDDFDKKITPRNFFVVR